MKIILFLILINLCSFSESLEYYENNILKSISSNDYTIIYDEKGFLSTAKYYKNDKLHTEYLLLDDGKFIEESQYDILNNQSITKLYYSKDNKITICILENEPIEDMVKNNKPEFIPMIIKNSCVNGEIIKFYKNGKIQAIEPYKNKLTNGILKVYYNNGELKLTKTYENGKANGLTKLYSRTGKLFVEMYFKDDLREGIQTIYSEDSKVKEHNTFSKDKYVKSIRYKQNGEPSYKINFKDGEPIDVLVYADDGKEKLMSYSEFKRNSK